MISIVVPTFNRSGYLRIALESFINQKTNVFEYEIIIVDNGSSDNTRAIVEKLLKNNLIAIRYIYEPRQGLHYARNTGIQNARGEFIVFGDDDIIAPDGWLHALIEPFLSDHTLGITGGKVLPLWNAPPPDWIYDYGNEKVHAVFACLDLGDAPIILESDYVFGCNFAIRRSLAISIGGSPPDTFPPSLLIYSGSGECEMIDLVRKKGFKVLYVPDAVVAHHADTSRATVEYFIYRYKRWAVENVYTLCRHHGFKKGILKSLISSVQILILGLYGSRVKKRPILFFRILLTQSMFQLRQIIFVILSPTVRANINRASFFNY